MFFLLLFTTLIVITILIDLIPLFKDWLGRIHIGRYNDLNHWDYEITSKAIKWLNHTPKIKVTDNTRLIVIDMLKGNYSKQAIQYWQEAALLLGIAEYLKNYNDEKVKNEVIKYLNSKFNSRGQWRQEPKTIDSAILAYAVMKVDFIDVDQYRPAFNTIWELIKNHIGADGTVKYREYMPDYRYVDTIGFICPFLVRYGTKYNAEECLELAVYQITEYAKNGMLKKHNIPYHAYEVNEKIPMGLNGWGRGMGWFAIGLIDAWNELPHSNKNKLILSDLVRKFAKVILQYQQENGSWNWTITRKEVLADSSSTATLSWYLLNASKIDEISSECLESVDKALDFLRRVTRRNGSVDLSQGDTKDIGVYSLNFNILPFTQGFCIRTNNLLKKIKDVKKNYEIIELSQSSDQKVSV